MHFLAKYPIKYPPKYPPKYSPKYPPKYHKTHYFMAAMGCPALGIWVAVFKQPDALPGRAPKKNKKKLQVLKLRN
jgi:hypothetical protein